MLVGFVFFDLLCVKVTHDEQGDIYIRLSETSSDR